MSQLASFYVLSKDNFDKYCKMANLVLAEPTPEETDPETSPRRLQIVSTDTIEYKNQQDYFKSLWDFLQQHGTAPYMYEWSGSVLGDLLLWLKESQSVDLTEKTMVMADDECFCWFVFDEYIRDKYAQRLNPANFTREGLVSSLKQLDDQKREELIEEVRARFGEKRAKELQEQMNLYAAPTGDDDDLDDKERFDKGQALMDGINILHNYMQLVDDKSLVILSIG